MEFPRKVLDYYWPNADSHIDICKTDFTKYANRIDILTGGFPCQPFSTAGKRKGTNDERYLWGEMLRAIQEIKPKFVIAENVFGITNIDGGLVFEQVCFDLEAEGYEVQPFIIPACGKNAPHKRERTWFIAYSKLYENKHSNNRRSKQKEGNLWRQNEGNVFNTYNSDGIIANSNSSRVHEQHIASESNKKNKFSRTTFERRDFSRFPSKPPICGGDDGISREVDGITFSKWRNESLKAYGNAIVPQVAFELFKQLELL